MARSYISAVGGPRLLTTQLERWCGAVRSGDTGMARFYAAELARAVEAAASDEAVRRSLEDTGFLRPGASPVEAGRLAGGLFLALSEPAALEAPEPTNQPGPAWLNPPPVAGRDSEPARGRGGLPYVADMPFIADS